LRRLWVWWLLGCCRRAASCPPTGSGAAVLCGCSGSMNLGTKSSSVNPSPGCMLSYQVTARTMSSSALFEYLTGFIQSGYANCHAPVARLLCLRFRPDIRGSVGRARACLPSSAEHGSLLWKPKGYPVIELVPQGEAL